MLSVRTIVGRISHPLFPSPHKRALLVDDSGDPSEKGAQSVQKFSRTASCLCQRKPRQERTEQQRKPSPARARTPSFPSRAFGSVQRSRTHWLPRRELRGCLLSRFLGLFFAGKLPVGWRKNREVIPFGISMIRGSMRLRVEVGGELKS